MSKLFSGKRYFLKPIKQPTTNDTYINQSFQDIFDTYSKSPSGISSNFSSLNKNNVTVEYSKNYSFIKSPIQILQQIYILKVFLVQL